MKSPTIAAGLAIALCPISAAWGASLSLGNPLAAECYEAAMARNDGPAGLAMCERALADEALHDRDIAATLVNRGILLMLRGRTAEADRSFAQAMRVDPGASDPPLNRALLKLRENKAGEALQLIEMALAGRDRQEAMIYYARGLAHEQAGNVRAAYADLSRARDLRPAWAEPERELARYRVTR